MVIALWIAQSYSSFVAIRWPATISSASAFFALEQLIATILFAPKSLNVLAWSPTKEIYRSYFCVQQAKMAKVSDTNDTNLLTRPAAILG